MYPRLSLLLVINEKKDSLKRNENVSLYFSTDSKVDWPQHRILDSGIYHLPSNAIYFIIYF
jgi:hypothetical protein